MIHEVRRAKQRVLGVRTEAHLPDAAYIPYSLLSKEFEQHGRDVPATEKVDDGAAVGIAIGPLSSSGGPTGVRLAEGSYQLPNFLAVAASIQVAVPSLLQKGRFDGQILKFRHES